ncbi:MAG: phospholipase, partial [Deinococcota bacterium]|nr:phospholipase [Deinococcota bacterium]
MAQTHRSFETTVTRRVRLNYLLHLPPGYEAHDQTDDKNAGAWPLVFFLHGAGERGSDLNKLK